jgi:hypothetical protein
MIYTRVRSCISISRLGCINILSSHPCFHFAPHRISTESMFAGATACPLCDAGSYCATGADVLIRKCDDSISHRLFVPKHYHYHETICRRITAYHAFCYEQECLCVCVLPLHCKNEMSGQRYAAACAQDEFVKAALALQTIPQLSS